MSLARDLVSAVLLPTGAAFCLLGALGLLRFPDTVSRLHAAAKAQTLGLLLVLLGSAAQLQLRYALVLALIALFQLVTVPVTGQIVGRTAYRTNVGVRTGLVQDELAERVGPQRGAAEAEDTDEETAAERDTGDEDDRGDRDDRDR